MGHLTEAVVLGYVGGAALLLYAVLEKGTTLQRLLLSIGALGLVVMVSVPDHWPRLVRNATFAVVVLCGLALMIGEVRRRRR
jgi:hypothetical protein